MAPKQLVKGSIVIATAVVMTLSVLLLSEERRDNVGGLDGEIGGEFTLESIDGPMSLSDFRGNAVVLYFGFVACSRICSDSMRTIASAFNAFSPEEEEKLRGILISIDPERDTVKGLETYTGFFHPNLYGLRGEGEVLEQVKQDYGVFFEIEDAEAGNYQFLHTSRYFIINQEGQLVDAMRHGTTANELKARLEQVLQSQT